MRLGLIAYAENTGLGSQTKAYYDHLKPYRTLVLERTGLNDPRTFHPERFPDAWRVVMTMPSMADCDAFLDGLDIVLMAECSPSEYLLRKACQRGVRTVIVPNYEYSPAYRARPDLYLAPTKWHFDDLPEPKFYVPFLIDPQIAPIHPKTAKNFLHIAGKPIFPDRNGTELVFQALQHVTSEIRMTVACQDVEYIQQLRLMYDIPANVHVVLNGPAEDWQDNYHDQDVLLMPRRFGGLCLPVNEALGFGMPVIMPDISPNNTWLPKHWLLPATKTTERKMAHMIDVYEVNPHELAEKIDLLATNPDFYAMSCDVARQIAEDYSWDRLLPKYMQTFGRLLP